MIAQRCLKSLLIALKQLNINIEYDKLRKKAGEVMDIKQMVMEASEKVIAMRRELHQYPELGTKEFETGKIICKYLNEYGIEYETGVADTGIVAIVRGANSGKTVAVRADIDALPIKEENDLEFKSKHEGVMHACGHDAHTAIALGTAIAIKKMEKDLTGNVKFFFQPAEESIGGAKRMIEAGCMKNPEVSHVIGLHVLPTVPMGKIAMRYGQMNANSGSVRIIVRGKSGHAAYPELSTDAIVMASNIVMALQTMVSRNTSPLSSVVFTLGKISGGTKSNIIADEVVLEGTLRTLNTHSRTVAKEQIKRIAENTATAMGGDCEVVFKDGYIALINDDELSKIFEEVAAEVVGVENVIHKEFPSMGGEDFSYFAQAVPSVFFHLGFGSEEKGTTFPLHNKLFMLDEDCLSLGMEAELRMVLRLLGGNESN